MQKACYIPWQKLNSSVPCPAFDQDLWTPCAEAKKFASPLPALFSRHYEEVPRGWIFVRNVKLKNVLLDRELNFKEEKDVYLFAPSKDSLSV
jgi:hypothetical protein